MRYRCLNNHPITIRKIEETGEYICGCHDMDCLNAEILPTLEMAEYRARKLGGIGE